MKNFLITFVCIIVTATTFMFMSGCDLDSSQIKTIANQSGLFSAVGWVAVDNPDAQTKKLVGDMVKVIKMSASHVDDGETYTEVLYPIILDHIRYLEVRYQPLVKAGSLALLGGIDILFAANPEWKQNETMVVDIVQSFCAGAINGLSMSELEPIIKTARRTAIMRSNLKLMQ